MRLRNGPYKSVLVSWIEQNTEGERLTHAGPSLMADAASPPAGFRYERKFTTAGREARQVEMDLFERCGFSIAHESFCLSPAHAEHWRDRLLPNEKEKRDVH